MYVPSDLPLGHIR